MIERRPTVACLNTGYDVRHATVQGYKMSSVARTTVTGEQPFDGQMRCRHGTLNQGD